MPNKNNTSKLTIFSWSLYDFANQPFTTIIITFIYSTYFMDYFCSTAEVGAVLWGRAITISSIMVALLSPIMGAIADNGGYRKSLLIFWTWVCIIFSFLLYFPIPGQVIQALVIFIIANIGFEMGGVFLNAYLPNITTKDRIGRISGYGWAFGYVGGLLMMAICFIFFIQPEIPINPFFGSALDKSTGEQIRIINIFIAIWFAIFSIPTFLFVKDDKKTRKIDFTIIKTSINNLIETFRDMKKYKGVLTFLLARLIYNDAVITIISFGGIYAKEIFDFTFNEIFLFGIVLNIAAGIGAFSFGFIDDMIGGKSTIQLTNFGFILACIIAVVAPTVDVDFISGKNLFWISGILIGVFMGPNQAASRSLMARITPESKENEFFGFYAFSGKATAFLGPLLFSSIVAVTHDLRIGIAVVATFFVIGSYVLSYVED